MGCGSPIMKLVAKVSMFLSSLAAIHQGLVAVGYNALDVLRLHEYGRPIGYVFGIAGIISLVMLCMWCMKHHGCGCSCGSCSSGSCGSCK
jgi:uncharacterized membrane protein YuzA (DUF378 family)